LVLGIGLGGFALSKFAGICAQPLEKDIPIESDIGYRHLSNTGESLQANGTITISTGRATYMYINEFQMHNLIEMSL
jgi:hypothetical protein